ncbi:MAG: hypothetical protein ACI837_000567, partial [Crocinitomicaceae bacterium]
RPSKLKPIKAISPGPRTVWLNDILLVKSVNKRRDFFRMVMAD